MDAGLSDIQADAWLRQVFPIRAKAQRYAFIFGGVSLTVAALVAVFASGGAAAVSVPFGVAAAALLLCGWQVRRHPGPFAAPCGWMIGVPLVLLCVMCAKFFRIAGVVEGIATMVSTLQAAAVLMRERPHLQAAKEWRGERPQVAFDEIARQFVAVWNSGRIKDLAQFLPERTRERSDEIWIEPLRELDWMKLLPRLDEPSISLRTPWEAQADYRLSGRRTALRTRWLHRDGAWGNVGRDWPKAVRGPDGATR